MPKRRSTRIKDFVEAAQEVEILKRQLATYPELKDSRPWMNDFNDAKVRANEFMRSLSGGDLAKAKALLAAGGNHDEE